MLRLGWIACLVSVAGLAGCGGSSPAAVLPTTVPVGGVVLLDGKPLPRASVKFIPRGATKGVECYGITDDMGKYELMQMRGGTGAPPGEYMVVVNAFAKPDGTPVSMGPGDPPPANVGAVESLPPRYSSYRESKLMAQVSASGGEFKFDLKSR